MCLTHMSWQPARMSLYAKTFGIHFSRREDQENRTRLGRVYSNNPDLIAIPWDELVIIQDCSQVLNT